MKKLYRIVKYVKATNALEAIQKDHKTQVYEAYIDDRWFENRIPNANRMVGLPTEAGEQEEPDNDII